MTHDIRGILIDPFERTVTAVTFPNSLDGILALLKVQAICTVACPWRDHVIYGDDEGLINGTHHGYVHPAYAHDMKHPSMDGVIPAQPIMGRCVVLGAGMGGNEISTALEPEVVERAIVMRWLELP